MDYFYFSNAADLTPLKTELVDVVLSCLIKEPPYEAVRPAQATLHDANWTDEVPRQRPLDKPPLHDGAAMVARMRELVHLISRQDGEFVLKLALYTRHTLHLRSSPNYLVALCAREPHCIPFLQPYMEQIVMIPSDWLSIANFAYFYDCDAAHDFSGRLAPYPQEEIQENGEDTASQVSSGPARLPTTASRTPVSPNGSSSSRKSPPMASREACTSARSMQNQGKPKNTKKACAGKGVDPTRAYLPSALRTSLVHCFKKFTPFSISKYDNEAAEHRARRRERRLLRKHEGAEGSGLSGSEPEAADNRSDSDGEDEMEGRAGNGQTTDAPRRHRRATFTYKLLIRMLHITQPTFLVCCLLGKRYPLNEAAFQQMGLHLTDPKWKPVTKLTFKATSSASTRACKAVATRVETTESCTAEDTDGAGQPYCIFNPSLSGTRMRLPVVLTWETLLSREGNTGKVWDFLIASRAVGYMALLRNLRNILTRTCSAATHKLVLAKLVDEQQVALSQQLPYRFYSAFLAVKEVCQMAVLLEHPLPASNSKARSSGRGVRGRRGAAPVQGELDERVRHAHASFENPATSRKFIHRYLNMYAAAIDSAVNTAARLNVIPMKGTSVVILCVTQALLEPMTAIGAAAETASIQRKVDVAALLIAMMMRSCEQCVVLLYCYDEYVMFREEDYVSTGAQTDFTAASADEEIDEGSRMRSGISSSSSRSGASCGGDSGLRSTNKLDSRSSDTSDTDSYECTRPQQAPHKPGFMKLVEALVLESTMLLSRKRSSGHVATPFGMFAKGSGAQFPYSFLDEVVERSMRVESLLVFDEGEHRTYAHMNRNAPAFGDLPTYLSRLRRTCSPDLVYVGVNLKAGSPPPSQGALNSAAAAALQQAAVKDRFHHRNDLLLTGFSDAILRLVAERVGGGPLSVIERAAEAYQVARFSARAKQDALAEQAKVMKIISALRQDDGCTAATAAAVEKTPTTAVGLGSPPVAFPSGAQRRNTVKGSVCKTAALESPSSRALESSLAQLPVLSTPAETVALPSFDAQGKVVPPAAWEVDWGHRARRSERQLQQLTGSSAGLSSSPASAMSSSSGPTALPSIRRLFSKQYTVDAEEWEWLSHTGSLPLSAEDPSDSPRQQASHVTENGRVVDADEAAWLSPRGKHASPIYHPRPFISLVKLLSVCVGPPANSAADDGDSGVTVKVARRQRRCRSRGPERSATPSPPSTATMERHDPQVRGRPSSVSPQRASSASLRRHRKATRANVEVAGAPLSVVRRLLTSYRVCRFFISSTFLDMNNERNAITLDIFPRLRRWAAEAGLKVTLLEVDLRWGIPAVATTRNLSTSVCLNAVSRCSPFFLGMIGSRYGSCPPAPLQLVADEDVEVEDYEWLSELTDPHVSVTELEMRHAMFNTRRRLGNSDTPTALFFERDYDHLMSTFDSTDVAARRVYEGDSPTAAQSIAALKQRIVESGYSLVTYKANYIRSNQIGSNGGEAAASGNSGSRDGVGDDAGDQCGDKSSSNNSGGGGGDVNPSSTRVMLEDDLGRWAVRGDRALGAVEPSSHTTESNSKDADSLWSFVKARISKTEEPRRLTSMDVPLDLSDFSVKLFGALQDVIRQVCGVRTDDSNAEAGTEAATQSGAVENAKGDYRARCGGNGAPPNEAMNGATPVVAASLTAPTAIHSPNLYETLIVAQIEYARRLSALYAAPRGLLEQLSSFAVSGTVKAPIPLRPLTQSMSTSADDANHSPERTGGPSRGDSPSLPSTQSAVGATMASGQGNSSLTASQGRESPSKRDRRPSNTSSMLLLEGGDGDGKSSTLAALVERVLRPVSRASPTAAASPLLFYSAQAGDDSVRSLLLFLAISYRRFFHLYAEMTVQESDSVEHLLLMLDQAYAIIHRRYVTSAAGDAEGPMAGPAALVVILDGLDKSSESTEFVSLLGTVLHPLAAPHIRFILSASPRSPLAKALRTRTPAACVVPLPLLSEAERAYLVRVHLAAYGKLLEESLSSDELKELLRKTGAGHPSRLISAVTYLRLFSTFDTLREDIRSLPMTSTQLYMKFFRQLQTRFDGPTCRLVLTLLLLRHPVGGVMEYNLYRLVSNVAVASRLVALLRGICLGSRHGRIFFSSTAFVAAVERAYLPFASDYQSAQERVLVAELQYQPVDMTVDEHEVRQALRRTLESIERSAVDPLTPCLFNPERYAPRELLGVLQGSIQASRLDVAATLVCHLPFLECLLANRWVLPHLIGLLSWIMRATKDSSDSATPVSSAGGGDTGGVVDVNNDADAVEGASSAFANGSLPLQWRPYRNEVHRIRNVLELLQTHYHILLRQPSLLRQCVWNALARECCISVYDTASMMRLRNALRPTSFASHASDNEKRKELQRDTGVRSSAGQTGVSSADKEARETTSTPLPFTQALPALWVHWLNLRQHGGETRVQLTTASPQAIRCMAMSSDETEVALGSDDGYVRRMGTSEGEDVLPTSQQRGPEKSRWAGGGRSGLAPMLRHEAAVAAVRYVPWQASGGFASSLSGRSVSGGGDGLNASPSSPRPQLLVSGCVRGIVYVWNLEDNSLLQRGTGHLRSISGLVCHPLQPTLLCSCSHDSYVMLWNLCGSRSQLSDEVASAIALRLPKFPAGSPARQQQQRMLRDGQGGGGGDRHAAAAYQSSLAAQSTAARPGYLTPLIAFHTERQHSSPVSCIDFHRTGDIMASGSWDGTLLLYNTHELCTPQPLMPYVPPQPKPQSLAATSAKTGTANRPKKWRVRHGPEYRQVAFTTLRFSLGTPVRSLSFSKSLAVTCVVGCHNGAIYVADYASSSIVARWTSLHTAPITCVLASPDGRCVASADEHGVVRLTYTGISGSVFATLNGHHGAVTGLSFRASFESAAEMLQAPQQMLLTAGEDRTLQSWRVNSSSGPEAKSSTRCLAASHSTAVTAVATSSDGLTLVTGSVDGTAIVFSFAEESDASGEWANDVHGASITAGDDASFTNGAHPLPTYRSGAALLKSNSLSITAAVAAAQEHRSVARPMTPSFVLRHDDGRITCIQFALKDTRIVVGVVSGLVYVWSSAPGLNRIEGRLLLRVRVPECGLYPVVSLGLRESVAAAATASNSSLDESREVYGALKEPRYTAESSRRHSRASHLPAAASSAGDSVEDNSTAVVTAVCANGDVAVLKLLGDAASRVMVADRNRRQHQRRLRHGGIASRRTGSFSGSSSCLELLEHTTGMRSSLFSTAGVEEERVESYPYRSCSVDVCSQTLPYLTINSPAAPLPVTSAHLAEPKGTLTMRTQNAPSPLHVVRNAAGMAIPHPDPSQCVKRQLAHRGLLDRRAVKLQRLLARCHVNEDELREGFQLELHRHHLEWANVEDAEEVIAVVWLSGGAKAPPVQDEQRSFEAGVGGGGSGENRHHKLALVVTQRKLFLMLSNGHESAVGGGLSIHIHHQTSDGALLLKNSDQIQEEGPAAASAYDSNSDAEHDTSSAHVPQQETRLPGSVAAICDSSHEFVVDVDYLLNEEEYFTAASAAVQVAAATTSTAAAKQESTEPHLIAAASLAQAKTETKRQEVATTNRSEERDAAMQLTPLGNAFVVALTTSRGEVLLLRIQVPHLRRRYAHPCTSPPCASPERRETTISAMGSATAIQLRQHVLPLVQVHLCQRLSFTKASPSPVVGADVVGGDAAAAKDGGKASTRSATAHRRSVLPVATAVQLSMLPSVFSTLQPHHQHAPTREGDAIAVSPQAAKADTVEQVVLVAGCSDGSARVWIAPASPTAACGRHSAPTPTGAGGFTAGQSNASPLSSDVPVGCFFCSSAVGVVSPLLQVSPAQQESKSPMRRSVKPSPLPRWVVGDILGNVYQLQLERDAPGKATVLLQCSAATSVDKRPATRLSAAAHLSRSQMNDDNARPARLGELSPAGGADARPWVSSLNKLVCMMEHLPSTEMLQTLPQLSASPQAIYAGMASNGSSDDGGVGGVEAAWSVNASKTPADWLVPVDFSAPVSAVLLKRSRAPSSPTCVSGASQKHSKTAPPAAACALPERTGTFLSFSISQKQVQSNLPTEVWSVLPSLPSTLRAAPPRPFNERMSGQPQGIANEANGAFDGQRLFLNPLPASPAALPSFGSSQQRCSSPARQAGGGSGGTPPILSIETPPPGTPFDHRSSAYEGEKDADAEGDMARFFAVISKPSASPNSLRSSATAQAPQRASSPLFPSSRLVAPVAGAPAAQALNSDAAAEVGLSAAAVKLRELAAPRCATASTKLTVTFDHPPPPPTLPLPSKTTTIEVAAAPYKPPAAPLFTAAQDGWGISDTHIEESNEEGEDGEDYFGILYESGPPPLPPPSPGSAGVANMRRGWLLRQQQVLKEALRVQRYNKDARAALRAYQQRAASVMGLS
ncbi:hypothetical protein ABL78_7333 [Leptomonas seymouri]|uniref:TROVE domain-containing protein n=1 Tax=Leptomonas seymouri TaxID=5684 RepID=A0A0N1I249_LEPSE|nr:hypothetical protein ABL78_7333 [Leptomonas seymouri]|eukprot:KPI83630.1 hypothetical protein ABL78_7333 [Leptomonas seymouri]